MKKQSSSVKKEAYFHIENNNFDGEEFDNTYSRKIYADIYIDDRNLLGIPEWKKIYEMILKKEEDKQK